MRVVAVAINDQQLSTEVQLQRMVGDEVSSTMRVIVNSIHRHAPKMVAAAMCAAGQVLNPAAPKMTTSSSDIMDLSSISVPTQVQGRFAVVRHCADWLIIDDTYNASPASMKAGLVSVLEWWHRQQHRVGSGVLILGDMLELGAEAQQLHEELGGWLGHQLNELSCSVKIMWCGAWCEAVKAGLARSTHERNYERDHEAVDAALSCYSSVAELMAAPPWQTLLAAVATSAAQVDNQVGEHKQVIYVKASHGIKLAQLIEQFISVAHSPELGL